MKNLKAQIEADIKSHAVFACHNLQASVAAIDFVALSLSQEPLSQDHQEQGYGVDGTTAVINVRGLLVPQMSHDRSNWGITAYNQIARYLARANSDPFIDDIRLDIDSSGGYVAGLDDVVEQIANLDKPITTFVSGDMYSAAYWLGVSTEKITAKKSSGIGSIGVFVVHSESSKGLEKQGDTLSIFRSGKWKGAFNWFSPLAKYEKDRLQQGVDDTASLFFNHVAQQRKLTAQQVKDWEGDVFTAQQAKECGLIDAIVGKSTTTASHVKQHKQQTAQQTVVAFNTGLASLTQNPKETTMELPQALAALNERDKRISELQRQVVQKDSLATTAMRERDDAVAEATQAKAELTKVRGDIRQKAIDELAEATGKQFGDDELAELKDASDGVFVMLKAAYTQAVQKPTLPSSWKSEQTANGADNEPLADTQDARFEQAKIKILNHKE